MRLPAQHTQNQIKHEKGAEDHETDKVHPWKLKAHCVIHLEGPRTPAEEEEEQWEERRRNRVKNALSRTQQAFNLQMETNQIFRVPGSHRAVRVSSSVRPVTSSINHVRVIRAASGDYQRHHQRVT